MLLINRYEHTMITDISAAHLSPCNHYKQMTQIRIGLWYCTRSLMNINYEYSLPPVNLLLHGQDSVLPKCTHTGT